MMASFFGVAAFTAVSEERNFQFSGFTWHLFLGTGFVSLPAPALAAAVDIADKAEEGGYQKTSVDRQRNGVEVHNLILQWHIFDKSQV